jgi:hypothetical protein
VKFVKSVCGMVPAEAHDSLLSHIIREFIKPVCVAESVSSRDFKFDIFDGNSVLKATNHC